MNGVMEGYKYFQENASGYVGVIEGANYIKAIENEIDRLYSDINNFKGYNTDVAQLKGDVAEFWHSGTHNIDAAKNGASERTIVDRSHDFASADIVGSSGEKYGLKYMADGNASSKAQAKSYFERYNEYKIKAKVDISFEEFLKDREIEPIDVLKHDPIYNGQIRVIPKDQMEEAVNWLQRKIAKESSIRSDQIKRYEETLELLRNSVKTNGGESVPISKEEAEKLARLAKGGEFDPSKYGLITEELLDFKVIMQQSVQAGLTSATISVVLKLAPLVYKSFEYLIQRGELDEAKIKELGFSALSGFSEGFIRGSVSAALTSSCKSGILGQSMKSIDPSIIGATTVIFMNVLKNSYEVSCGRMTKREVVNELIKDIYVSTFALVAGGITQSLIEIPVLGYMLGSFIGSMIGGITYEVGYSKIISFCVETGFTMFGLFDQDYYLSEQVIKQLGFDIYELDNFKLDSFEYEKFEYDKFELDKFECDEIEIVILRRGVIGINRIGYL